MRTLLLALVLAAIPAGAFAHAMLDSATPAVGSIVSPTDTIRLRYSQGIEPPALNVTVAP